jgi:hypothetical protein
MTQYSQTYLPYIPPNPAIDPRIQSGGYPVFHPISTGNYRDDNTNSTQMFDMTMMTNMMNMMFQVLMMTQVMRMMSGAFKGNGF